MNALYVFLQAAYQEQQSENLLSDIIKTILFLGFLALIVYLIVKGIKYLIKVVKKGKKAVKPTPMQTNVTEELKKMKELLDQGILTQDEFDEQKKKILNH